MWIFYYWPIFWPGSFFSLQSICFVLFSFHEINHRGWPVRFRAGLSLIRVLQDLFTLILLHFAILRLKLQFFVVKNLVSGKARYSNSTLLRVHSVKTNPLHEIRNFRFFFLQVSRPKERKFHDSWKVKHFKQRGLKSEIIKEDFFWSRDQDKIVKQT